MARTNKFCRCGWETYRPETYDGRRQALRCRLSNYTIGRCPRATFDQVLTAVISQIAVSSGWNHVDAVGLVDALLTLHREEVSRQERERIANDVIFDLPIGDDINYSRGYNAAIREMRRVLREEQR